MHEDRIAELDQQIAALREQIAPLTAERDRLVTDQKRAQWPDGPFTLTYYRYSVERKMEFDEPFEALQMAESIEDAGDGSTQTITDKLGNLIYDLRGYPPKRVAEGYPEPPDDC